MDEPEIIYLADPPDADKPTALAPGVTVIVEGTTTLYLVEEIGSLRELEPDEHPAYVEVGSIHGRPELPDEPDVDENDFLQARLGRVGPVYFRQNTDPWYWEWIGQVASDQEAIAEVCPPWLDFRWGDVRPRRHS